MPCYQKNASPRFCLKKRKKCHTSRYKQIFNINSNAFVQKKCQDFVSILEARMSRKKRGRNVTSTQTRAPGMRCPEKSRVDFPRKNGCMLFMLLGQGLAGTRSQKKTVPAAGPKSLLQINVASNSSINVRMKHVWIFARCMWFCAKKKDHSEIL